MTRNPNAFDLKKMTVLVTGATGYLGKDISIGLAEAGAHVLVNSRDLKKAKELSNLIKLMGLHAEPACFDISDRKSIKTFFEEYKGELSIIVNNAYNGKGGTIEHSNELDFANSYHLVVSSANNIFQASLPLLRKSVHSIGYSSIINISSMYGTVSPDLGMYKNPLSSNPPFYGAAKAALIQWSKYGACEFGHEGIRFNCISPGPFPNTQNSPEFISKLAAKVPMARVGKSHEMKGPVVFLASSASSFVNGTNLKVDGGWTAW